MSVNLSLLAGAGWQFFTDDGVPLAGGLLYTYAAGTTTPQATYTSSSGLTAHANPIVLNSAGRVAAGEVWLTNGYSYKFLLKDASNVQIASYDNIPGFSSNLPIINDASSIAYEQGYTVTAGSFVVGDIYLITSVGTTNFITIGASSNTVGVHFTATGAGSGTGTAQRSRTVQAKLRESLSVEDFGAVGDGVTDDTAAIQAAIDASADWSNVTITGLGGAQSVGGGHVIFPQTSTGYKITAALNIPTKIVLEGPAKIIGTTGQNIFTFVYTGSTSHTGVVIRNLDFVGGDIGINIGDQAVAIPAAIYNCMFVNQQVSGIKLGQYGYNTTIRDNLFTGSVGYGVWSNGQAADGLLIDHNTFVYNYNYDIYVQNNNTLKIINNAFVGNQKTPVSGMANIYVDTAASSEIGSYSVIQNNKFGQEGRTGGNCIVFAGTGNVLSSVAIENNLLHFESGSTQNYAINVGVKGLRGITIRGNSVIFCSLIDTSSMLTSGFTTANSVNDNLFISGSNFSQMLRGNWEISDHIEPQPFDKYNILEFSHYVNSGANFTYTNATPSYMTSTDENGIANNATSVIATAANNIIRINSVNTSNAQKFYSMALWLKLDAEGDVLFSCARASNYAFFQTIKIGTTFQRISIPFYQTYLATGNPYIFDLTIPNGATVTLGAVCVVPGRDVGDLFKTTQVTEKYGLGIYSSASPSTANGGYSPAGRRAFNSAPAVGQPKGWICTVAGDPGTWVSEGNL